MLRAGGPRCVGLVAGARERQTQSSVTRMKRLPS